MDLDMSVFVYTKLDAITLVEDASGGLEATPQTPLITIN